MRISAVSPSAPIRSASIRFICGVPMKLATKAFAGLAKTSCGVPICSIRPSRMIAVRLAMVSASSWSWVTITVALREALEHFLDLAAHGLAQLDVETRQRLVEQEAVGVADDGAGDGDALLLAFGDLAGQAVEDMGELQRFGDRPDAAVALGRGQALGVEREAEVLADGQRRVERVELEHHRDVALFGRAVVHALAGDDHVAFGGLFEAGDDAQRGGLAAAGGAEQADHLAGRHREVDVAHGGEAAEALGDAAKLDRRHQRFTVPKVTPRSRWSCR